MPTCNIDARGQIFRLISGSILAILAIVTGVLVYTGVLTAAWWWIIAGVVLFVGLFMLYEARTGWCLLRALGIQSWI